MTIVYIVALPAVHGSSTVAFTRPRAASVALSASGLGHVVLVLVWLHMNCTTVSTATVFQKIYMYMCMWWGVSGEWWGVGSGEWWVISGE